MSSEHFQFTAMSEYISQTPDNPCIRHCCLDERNVCVGCYRTLAEILNWHESNAEQKQAIIERCEQRRLKRLDRMSS
ncbi:DUF1289 domain-containing protein [Pseudoalteromonas xiamenensis]